MCEECAPYFTVSRLLGCSGFDDSFGRVEDAASDNIQEIIILGDGFLWNDDAVYDGRM